ncbi:hypothetical protein C6501_19590 [Candidatus Poribacteria bacterium]|nr:MAG: hypothetical protein C6501_19590 [Candidatus Poribacteria bacterium]
MQEYPKKIVITAIVIAMMWIPMTTLAQETHLRWKNGDALSGKLLESKSGKIRWTSPYFSDDLIIDINVLDSIVFSKQLAPATETFRVGTILGDVWIADIIGSDENTLHFFSKRHGKFRVNRELIYSLESRSHPNLIFDGSQLSAWKSPKENIGRKAVENQHTGWYPDHNGHPHTDQKKANIFHTLEWPKRFEIDLELASTIPNPGFVLALGKNLYETLRVETWIHELVVVQGTLFESIMAIGPDRRSFRLRLAYDQDLGMLKVFDLNGNLLLELENVQPTLASPGLYIYNRGQNLTIRRLKVYRQPAEFKNQQADFSKPRVHMMNGEVFYGKLFVEKDKAYVLDTDEGRSDINLQQVDRVVQPGKTLTTTNESMALAYIDGSVIRGQIVQLDTDSVLLQTAFADQPVTCSFAGASMLRFESKAKIKERGQDYDKMFFPSNSLRGHVIFDGKDTSSIQLQPVGTSEPVSLANTQSVRVERNNKHVSRLRPFDVEIFPHLLHLKNGEVIPCKVLTCDQTAVSLQSPFISATRIDTAHIKGIEFTRGKTQTRKENRNPITITGGDKHRIILEDGRKLDAMMQRAEDGTLKIIVNNEKPGENPKVIILGGDFAANDVAALQHGVEVMFDPLETQSEALDVRLERALTVPRFNRDNPPNHILVANNGDLRRGKFLSFNGGTILFESNLKKISIPIDRVARIVDISVEDSDTSTKETVDNQQPTPPQSQVRFALIHNPILIFEPLEVKGDKLYGRSPIYGEVSVPVKSIQYLHFGEKAKSFKSVFEEWVIRAAKEPDYGADR